MSTKGPDTPIVIVGNKSDLDRTLIKVTNNPLEFDSKSKGLIIFNFF